MVGLKKENVLDSLSTDKQNLSLSFSFKCIPKDNFTVDSFIHLASIYHLLYARHNSVHFIAQSSVCFGEESDFGIY